MSTVGRHLRVLVERIRRLPIDLVLVLAFVILVAVLVLLRAFEGTFPRLLLGLPLILFVPGYAFIAALFPEAGRTRASPRSDGDERGRILSYSIDSTERLILSVGTSVVIAPLIGLVLNYTPWKINLESVVLSLGTFTVIAAFVAILRRQALPEDARFAVVRQRPARTSSTTPAVETRTRTDLALTVAVALTVVLVISSVVYAVVVPRGGEPISEFYLLTRNETTGELVTDEYPTTFVRGEPKPLVVGIENHERRSVNYTVIVAHQRINDRNGSTVVVEQRRLHRFQIRVGANESQLRRHTITPSMTGERLRLTYLLYRGAAPPSPSVENAYREVHLWISVSAPNESSTSIDTDRHTIGVRNAPIARSAVNGRNSVGAHT